MISSRFIFSAVSSTTLFGIDRVVDHFLSNQVAESKLPVQAITVAMLEDFYVYDTAAAKLATSASERTTLTHELEEIHESASALKRAWDTMKDLAKQDVDDRKWHKTLLDKLRVDAKFNANVIGIFGADAAAEITKEINQGDEGAAHSLHDLRERMRNAGEMSNDLIEKSIRRMKGHDWEKSVAGKIINLRRIAI